LIASESEGESEVSSHFGADSLEHADVDLALLRVQVVGADLFEHAPQLRKLLL
jgi:hypothetical protein